MNNNKFIRIIKKSKYSILVNKENEYIEKNKFKIIEVETKYAKNRYLEEKTYLKWKSLQDFSSKNGYEIELESGYRSRELQSKIFDEVVKEKGLEHTEKYVAKPGFSEHQTGLAIDYCLKENNKYIVEFELKGKSVLPFIEKNCHKFGFILRYPKGKEKITGYNNEPWHLRYVGKRLAKYLYNNNKVLEEL